MEALGARPMAASPNPNPNPNPKLKPKCKSKANPDTNPNTKPQALKVLDGHADVWLFASEGTCRWVACASEGANPDPDVDLSLILMWVGRLWYPTQMQIIA